MINAAQHNGFATYQEIAPANGFQLCGNVMGNKISELIGLVSKNEVNQGRPMMSAIVVGVNGKPGKGFYEWADELGVMSEGDNEESFWKGECEKIYEDWKMNYSYDKK